MLEWLHYMYGVYIDTIWIYKIRAPKNQNIESLYFVMMDGTSVPPSFHVTLMTQPLFRIIFATGQRNSVCWCNACRYSARRSSSSSSLGRWSCCCCCCSRGWSGRRFTGGLSWRVVAWEVKYTKIWPDISEMCCGWGSGRMPVTVSSVGSSTAPGFGMGMGTFCIELRISRTTVMLSNTICSRWYKNNDDDFLLHDGSSIVKCRLTKYAVAWVQPM